MHSVKLFCMRAAELVNWVIKGSHTYTKALWRAMMKSGLPPLYTSLALACTHTQPHDLDSSRKTVSPLSPVFITVI